FRWRRLPRWDEAIPLPSKLRGYFFDPCDRCCRCSVGCSPGRKGCISPSHPFERFHRCPRLDNALLLTPVAWRSGLRLLRGELQSALYVTALQVWCSKPGTGMVSSCITCVTCISAAHIKHCIATAPFPCSVRCAHPSCVSFEDVRARVASRQAAPPLSHA